MLRAVEGPDRGGGFVVIFGEPGNAPWSIRHGVRCGAPFEVYNSIFLTLPLDGIQGGLRAAVCRSLP